MGGVGEPLSEARYKSPTQIGCAQSGLLPQDRQVSTSGGLRSCWILEAEKTGLCLGVMAAQHRNAREVCVKSVTVASA